MAGLIHPSEMTAETGLPDVGMTVRLAPDVNVFGADFPAMRPGVTAKVTGHASDQGYAVVAVQIVGDPDPDLMYLMRPEEVEVVNNGPWSCPECEENELRAFRNPDFYPIVYCAACHFTAKLEEASHVAH